MTQLLDLFLHLDQFLATAIETYGTWVYGLLFVIVFAETGLVITPYLPGDSLLFAAGTFAGRGSLSVPILFAALTAAAILGDTVNYWAGKWLGSKLVHAGKSRWIRRKHLDRTHTFFETYGAKTIVIARFVPIVRTFAPFLAGVGGMNYRTFFIFNVVGGALWVGLCIAAGYCFGGLAFVQKNFSLVILAIVVISILPAVVEYVRAERAHRRVADRSQPARPGREICP